MIPIPMLAMGITLALSLAATGLLWRSLSHETAARAKAEAAVEQWRAVSAECSAATEKMQAAAAEAAARAKDALAAAARVRVARDQKAQVILQTVPVSDDQCVAVADLNRRMLAR